MLDILKQELRNFKSPLYRNSIYISATSIMTAVSGFIFWNIAARFYPPSDVGLASALNSTLLLLILISKLGLDFALIRFYPIYKEKAVFTSLVSVLSSSIILSIGYIFINNEVLNTFNISGWWEILTVLLFVVSGSLLSILGNFFLVQRRGELYFVQQSILVVIKISMLFVLVSFQYLGILLSIVLGSILSLLFSCLHLVKFEKIQFTVSLEYVKSSMSYAIGNYISTLLNFSPNYLMPTLVLVTLGKEQVAYYYIAFTLGNILLLVPNAFNMSFFVEGSHGADTSRLAKKVLTVSLMYMIIAVISAWFLGRWILMFFGNEYLAGLRLFQLVSLSGFFVIIVNLYLTLLNIKKNIKMLVFVNTLKGAMFLVWGYVMMNKYGLTGVGYAWVLTNLILALVGILGLRGHYAHIR